MNENREVAGTPVGGRFAISPLTEPGTSLPAPRPGYPDGPMRLTTFDIDGQFGPLVGYDDGRRWNGFAEPWLTQESLERVKAATAAWAAVDADVEWLDDEPDGVWRLHTRDAPPVGLEQAHDAGPHLESLHRLTGWCWDSRELGFTEDGEPRSWVDEASDPADRPHPRKAREVDGHVVRPTAVCSEDSLLVTDPAGAVWKAHGHGIWGEPNVVLDVEGDPAGDLPDAPTTRRVRAAAVAAAPSLLVSAAHST